MAVELEEYQRLHLEEATSEWSSEICDPPEVCARIAEIHARIEKMLQTPQESPE